MVKKNLNIIKPVLLSGGTGTRLWPLSRESYPKQLLALVGEKTLLQQAALRVADPALFAPLTVIANADHRFVVAEQLRTAGLKNPRIVLEPVGRNTAPAVTVAALLAQQDDLDALLLVMPADHVIADNEAFVKTVRAGASAAAQGALVLFGIKPSKPVTGYGYIRTGPSLREAPEVRQVSAFAEKPDEADARRYVASGDYLWNSGIFLLPATRFLVEVERLAPEVLRYARQAIESARTDMDFLRLDPEAFARCPSISLDYAVMEKTGSAAVVPADFGWSDVGAWSALWEIGERDAAQNVLTGAVVAEHSRNCYLRSEGPLVAALGVEDLIVVATTDAVLVAHKQADEQVKQLVERLRREGRAVATATPRVHRPWGFYESLQSGARFQVKRITVNPGHKISLQRHCHRAEHWVVVSGTALVRIGEEERMVQENESVFIPLGAIHRLHNPGEAPLDLIEVQSGTYLGEDDIVRLEDAYART